MSSSYAADLRELLRRRDAKLARKAASGRVGGEAASERASNTPVRRNERNGETPPEGIDSFHSFIRWPSPLAEPAYHGLPGDLVRALEPHTEADPAALLGHLLMMFGNIIGRGPHYVVEGTCHYTNANLLVIGDTAAGRKGSAEGRIRQLFHLAEPDWVANHITGGLSSGEGLIWSVRDPILKQPPRKGNGPVGENEIVDPGVADKRLVILESEFASVLRVMSREGNTLSAVIRQAFDGANLNIATKNSPARATGAHISVIGHITPEELRTTLKRAEAANGFLNRFLLVCARRSKSLPDGGTVRERDLKPIVERLLLPAVEFAKGVREMHRDEAARELWHHEYPALTQGRPGLLGAVAARGPAHAVRLSLVYALLDQSDIVRRPHLEAALAFWRYAEDSAAFIFGQSLGSPDAEVLAEHLRTAGEAGLTLTEMHHRFSGNASAARLRAALAALEAQGVARAVDPAGRTGPGRPAERWRYAGARPEGRDEETNETNNLTTMAPS